MLSSTAKKAIDAYGGIDLWQKAKGIEAEVSVTGLAFTVKRRPFFDRAKIKMQVEKPVSEITPIGKDGNITGVLNAGDIFLQNVKGEVISERKNAREYFSSFRRNFFWDDLDMAYFANYAFWNYFTLPRLLLNKEIQWSEKEKGVLKAQFPDSIPTHNTLQEFHFDTKTGLLKQHNYTADIISRFARAAHVVVEHSEESGVKFPSVRKVSPRLPNGKALGKPGLIEIEVHSFNVNPVR